MRFALSTGDFIYGGAPRPGFPLILDDSTRLAQPFHTFLQWLLLDSGTLREASTWETYGRWFWDFVMFLSANGRQWNEKVAATGKGVFVAYRDWSISEVKNERSTVKQRLRLVAQFYRWAASAGLITDLPFTAAEENSDAAFYLARGRHGGASVPTEADFHEYKKPPPYLTTEQFQTIRTLQLFPSHRLLFELMLRVGLRNCEARTFPIRYVFTPPRGWPDRQMIPIVLSPHDMYIKRAKERSVDIPCQLMRDLAAYRGFERGRLLGSAKDEAPSPLILNQFGRPYTKDGVGLVFREMSGRAGFRATALMLRHSYAVYTLLHLRRNPHFRGDPLLYVQKQLGHSDVSTTLQYLDEVNRVDGGLAMQLHNEFDFLFEPRAVH